MLKYLSKFCSKIIDNIQRVEGKDRIISEIYMYSVDEARIDINLSFVDL